MNAQRGCVVHGKACPARSTMRTERGVARPPLQRHGLAYKCHCARRASASCLKRRKEVEHCHARHDAVRTDKTQYLCYRRALKRRTLVCERAVQRPALCCRKLRAVCIDAAS